MKAYDLTSKQKIDQQDKQQGFLLTCFPPSHDLERDHA